MDSYLALANSIIRKHHKDISDADSLASANKGLHEAKVKTRRVELENMQASLGLNDILEACHADGLLNDPLHRQMFLEMSAELNYGTRK